MDEELGNDVHPSDSDFPLFKGNAAPSARVVTLHPGEVLYVPPFWLVRAEFPVLSAFLDVPSLSEELVSAFGSIHVMCGCFVCNLHCMDLRVYFCERLINRFLHFSALLDSYISKRQNSPMFLWEI